MYKPSGAYRAIHSANADHELAMTRVEREAIGGIERAATDERGQALRRPSGLRRHARPCWRGRGVLGVPRGRPCSGRLVTGARRAVMATLRPVWFPLRRGPSPRRPRAISAVPDARGPAARALGRAAPGISPPATPARWERRSRSAGAPCGGGCGGRVLDGPDAPGVRYVCGAAAAKRERPPARLAAGEGDGSLHPGGWLRRRGGHTVDRPAT